MKTSASGFSDGYSHLPPGALDDVQPSAVLESAAAQQQYERIRSVFYYELESLNTTVFLLQRMHDFPLNLFTNHPRPLFWSHITDRLYEAAVICIAKLVLPPSRQGSFTLRSFEKWLGENIRSEYRAEFKARREGIHFEQKFRSLKPRIGRLRREIFAHLDRSIVFGAGDLEEKDFVDLRELSECCALLCQLLDALSIGSRNLFLPVEYVTTNQESDIDELLRLVAEASGVVQMPEKKPQLWNALLESLAKERADDLALITEWRRKLGKPTPWDKEDVNPR